MRIWTFALLSADPGGCVGLRRGSAAAWLPGLRVRISLRPWMSAVFVVCCVGSGLCGGVVICSEESYRVCVCVWLSNFVCNLETSKWSGLGPIWAVARQKESIYSSSLVQVVHLFCRLMSGFATIYCEIFVELVACLFVCFRGWIQLSCNM